jgi:hypothetical protein
MKELTREEAIDDIREVLLGLAGEGDSVCKVATELGVFCGGFSQWGYDDLKQRFHWIVERHPDVSRAELEALANRWCLTRQFPEHGRITCDLMARAPRRNPCAGWDEWYEAEIAGFYAELLGEKVSVHPNPLPALVADRRESM